jgi:hypothetical protein
MLTNDALLGPTLGRLIPVLWFEESPHGKEAHMVFHNSGIMNQESFENIGIEDVAVQVLCTASQKEKGETVACHIPA